MWRGRLEGGTEGAAGEKGGGRVGEGEGSLTSAKKVLAFLASFYHRGLNLLWAV